MPLDSNLVLRNQPRSLFREMLDGIDRGQAANARSAAYRDDNRKREREDQQINREEGFRSTLSRLVNAGADYRTPTGQESLLKGLASGGYAQEAMELAQRFPKSSAPKYNQYDGKDGAYMVNEADPSDVTPLMYGNKRIEPRPKEFAPQAPREWDPLGQSKLNEDMRHNKAMETANRINAAKPSANAPKQGEVKLNNSQSGMLAEISEANIMVDNIAGSFNKAGMAKSPGKAWAADAVESLPFIGGKLAPKTSQYNDDRRITAEKFLRAATGAAAPDHEVAKYAAMLPEPGDNSGQAQSAIDSFRSAVKAKAMSVASTLDLEGRTDEAGNLRGRLEQLFGAGVQIDGAKTQPAPSPQNAPAAGKPVRWGRDANGRPVKL